MRGGGRGRAAAEHSYHSQITPFDFDLKQQWSVTLEARDYPCVVVYHLYHRYRMFTIVSHLKALMTLRVLLNARICLNMFSSSEIERLVLQDLQVLSWADPETYSPILHQHWPLLGAASSVQASVATGCLHPSPSVSPMWTSVLYVALLTPCRENKALVNTKAEILYTFCRCIVFFWLFTFYDAQQQKLYCFNNVQCTFMDLNSSSDFRLK